MFKEEIKEIMKKKLNKMRTLMFEEVMRVELILIFDSVLVRLLLAIPPVVN